MIDAINNTGASLIIPTLISPGAGQIWLDDLECTGTEARLVDCGHPPFGTHNCTHNDDVGSRCIQRPRKLARK